MVYVPSAEWEVSTCARYTYAELASAAAPPLKLDTAQQIGTLHQRDYLRWMVILALIARRSATLGEIENVTTRR